MSLFGKPINTTTNDEKFSKLSEGYKMFLYILFLLWCKFQLTIESTVSCDFGEYEICFVKNQTILASEPLVIERPTGVPFTELNLNIDDGTAAIPNNILVSYPNISSLSVAYSGLRQILYRSLAGCQTVSKLSFYGGFVKRVFNGTFRDCASLLSLSLSRQQIVVLEINAFVGLANLRILTLRENKILNLNAQLFRPLPNLNMLDVSTNNLTKLGPNIFINNPGIFYLAFDSNQLVTLPANLLNKATILDTISFNDNRLTSAKTFGAKIAFLNRNRLQTVQLQTGLERIVLADNVATTFTCPDANLSSIKFIYADNNAFTSYNCFGEMDNVERIELTNSKLPRPTPDIFAKLTALDTLEISGQSRFIKIAAKAFAPLISLQSITVSSFVEYRNLRQLFPKLTSVSLVTKTWNCTYAKRIMGILNKQKIRMSFADYTEKYICNLTQPYF